MITFATTTTYHHDVLLIRRIVFVVVLLFQCLSTIQSWTTSYNSKRRAQQQLSQQYHYSRLYMSEPSDTSSEDFTNDDFPGYGRTATTTTSDDDSSETTSPNQVYVTNVLELLPTSILSNDINEEVRSAINEAILKLEHMSSSSSSSIDGAALSPLLNGVWELKYYGGYTTDGFTLSASPTRQFALFLYSGGYSPGMFAYQTALSLLPKNNPLVTLGPIEITISRVQPRIEATVPIQIGSITNSYIRITAKLEVKSNIRLRETYESINIVGLTNVPIPSLLQYSRDIYVTYVDNDLLIIRDGSGIPEILIRKEKVFTKTWGNDPVDMDDTIPPGVSVADIMSDDTNDNDDSPSY